MNDVMQLFADITIQYMNHPATEDCDNDEVETAFNSAKGYVSPIRTIRVHSVVWELQESTKDTVNVIPSGMQCPYGYISLDTIVIGTMTSQCGKVMIRLYLSLCKRNRQYCTLNNVIT